MDAVTENPSSNGRSNVGTGPHDQGEDCWRKSCALTLDGGGTRGYASLWMMKILMDEIERIETTHPDEIHESSFWPPRKDMSYTNGRLTRQTSRSSGDDVPDGPHHSSTDMSVVSQRSRKSVSKTFRKHRNTETAGTSPQRDQSLKPSAFLPCHYFDYICGTSTGGLNAIMLGRLRMSVDECLERYPRLANSIFGEGKKRSVATRVATLNSTKYNSTQLETAIREIVTVCIPGHMEPRQREYDFNQFRSPEDLCKTAVVANEDHDVGEITYVFRSYDQPFRRDASNPIWNPGEAHTHEIWQVARATSAAPTFFEPIVIAGKEYSDGGVGNNNPTLIMADEVMEKNAIPTINDAFAVVLSIGTGQKPTTVLKVKRKFPRVSSWKPVKKLTRPLRALKNKAVDVEKDHNSFLRMARQVGFKHYYRWSGGEEVGGLKMDEWVTVPKRGKEKTADFIEKKVRNFMEDNEIKAQVERLAQELVAIRRARIRNLERIRRFTWCTLYKCPICPDHDLGEYQETLDALRKHISERHRHIPPADIEGTIRHIPARPPAKGACF